MPNRQCNCADYDTSCRLCDGSADREDVAELSLYELRSEYERSQWALAHALEQLGGKMVVPGGLPGKICRVWYSVNPTTLDTVIEIREHKGPVP